MVDSSSHTRLRSNSAGSRQRPPVASRLASVGARLPPKLKMVTINTIHQSQHGGSDPTLDSPVLPTADSDGFVPPWADWDCNEWENCTDTEQLLVRS